MEYIGHRGAKRELPENTLAAFQRAFQRGADAIELDVHGTVDGIVVVHHDPDLRGRLIAEMTSSEVAQVQLAPGVGVPTLAEVLKAAPADATVYVEIKGEGIEQHVAEVIGAHPVKTAVHSFDHAAVARMAVLAPHIPRGILFDDKVADLEGAMHRTGARDVWPNWKLIDAALVAVVHAAGGRVIAWTVNDSGVAARLTSLGVDGLCGDDVRLFLSR